MRRAPSTVSDSSLRPSLPRGSSAGGRSRIGWSRALGAVAVAGLTLFHAVLLAGRFADATLAHPEVLAQWFAALLLGLGAFALRRQGRSLLSGRGALVFWLLVLLLHVGFGSGLTLAGDEATGARQLLLLLPFAAFSVRGCASLERLPGKRRRSRRRGALPNAILLARYLPPSRLELCSAGPGPERFSPRPPPLS